MILDCYNCERKENCDIYKKRLTESKDEIDLYLAKFTKPKNCPADSASRRQI